MTDKSHIIFKGTFEAVDNSQQQFRRHLETLIKENRPLKDEEEKTLFYRELSHSTLGLGVFKVYNIQLERMYRFGNVESTARWLAGQTDKMVVIPGDCGKVDSFPVKIKVLWEKLLDLLYFVFPNALDKSISMSKEGESFSGRQDSFHIGSGKNG